MNSSFSVFRASRRQALEGGFRERDEFHVPLVTALARLRPRTFEILLLHYKHNYSNAQIAELLGTSHGTIAVTLTRLRTRLRKALHSVGYDREGTSLESLRALIDRHVQSPSQLEMRMSRDWILERVRSTPPHPQQLRTEEGEAVVSWWRRRFERCL